MKNKLELTLLIGLLLLVIFGEDAGMLLSFVLVLLYIFIGKERKAKINSVGFYKPMKWSRLLIVTFILGFVIEISFQIFINPVVESLTNSNIDLSAFDGAKGNIPTYLAYVALGFVVGGFLEEVLFRGFLLTRIAAFFKKESTGYIIAIAFLSILFGFAHMYQGWAGVINTGLTSVFFGLIYLKFNKNLWYAIFTHGFVNLVGFSVIFFDLTEKLENLIF